MFVSNLRISRKGMQIMLALPLDVSLGSLLFTFTLSILKVNCLSEIS